MKYFNKNLYDNEIYKYIIQILGNSSTEIKLMIMEISTVIVIDNQWKISIGKDDISIVSVQVKRLIFKFSNLSMMDCGLISRIKEVIRGLLYSRYNNERVFNLICGFSPELSLFKKHISQDNQSHFRWFFDVSYCDGILGLSISIYESFRYVGDIKITLNTCKILELFYSIPGGVYYMCNNPNNTKELIEFINDKNDTLNNEKNK